METHTTGHGHKGTRRPPKETFKPDEEPSLADQFLAATYVVPKQFRGRAHRVAEEALLRYRVDMRQAHRFVLADDFTEMATYLSHVAPERTLARLQYATLPYEQTWIECSLHVKMRTIHHIHNKPTPEFHNMGERMGLLIQRIDSTTAVCTIVNAYKDWVLPASTAYFFSTAEADFGTRPSYGCAPVVMPVDLPKDKTAKMTRREAMDLTRASLWGYGANKDRIGPDDSLINLKIPKFLERHGDVGISRMNPAYLLALSGDRLSEMMVEEIREFSGTIRWLVTVLALLNEVPVSTTKIERTGFMRAGRLGKNKLLDHHKVTLLLPKTVASPFKYYERKLSHGDIQRRRAHEVRSHWRTYLNEVHCGFEEHDWVYDEEHGYRLCGKCDAYSTLIPNHIRGDAKLGWVNKNYILKAAT